MMQPDAAFAYPAWPSLAAMLFDRAAQWPDRPALSARRGKAWQATNWATLAQGVATIARLLRAAGVGQGDRVLILSENRPEWPMADFAIMTLGAVTVPAFTTWTAEDLGHVLRDCGARHVIVSGGALLKRLAAAAGDAPPDYVLLFDPMLEGGADALFGKRTEVLPAADRFDTETAPWAAEAKKIDREALACLIYTSGTGGAPKGVMLPHRAMLSNGAGAHALFGDIIRPGEIYLSFLPLSHSFERTVGQCYLLSIGTHIHYSRGIEHLPAELSDVRPTILTVVPRLLEVIRARILAGIAKEGGLKQALFDRTLAAGMRKEAGQASLLDRLLDPLLDRLVREKVRARFGGRLKGMVSGGARLDPEVGRFFRALGMPLVQGYGQTEAGPVISCNPLHATRIDTVGPPLQGVDLRITEDGEIQVKGDLVMQGYWNNPAASQAAMDGAWLRTGDIGAQDADGYIRITDRKKDILVLSGGDNVAPARIEGALLGDPAIAQAAVFGDGRPYLVAVIVPSEEARRANPTIAALARALSAAVERANAQLSITERVRRFHVADQGFTIENGMLTPTQKVRRHKVRDAHQAAITGLYG
jgi:long-chain acyl-CoA synthetase